MWKDDEWIPEICNHCGVETVFQPPASTGCNHVHYPEACSVCSVNAAYTRTVVDFDLTKVCTARPDLKRSQIGKRPQ